MADDFYGNKSIIITGASSGIGLALCQKLQSMGANLTIMARSGEILQKLSNDKTQIFPGDVSCEHHCQGCVDLAIKSYGRIDILIHNAGVSQRSLFEETKLEVYRQLMDINYFSLLYLLKAALGHLVATKGQIVAISSLMGRFGMQTRTGYAASKHAMQGFCDSLRLELMTKDVHILSVSPGFVNTNLAQRALVGDGSTFNKADSNISGGLSVNTVTDQILIAIKKRKRDIYPAAFKEKLALFLSKTFPSLLDKMISKKKQY